MSASGKVKSLIAKLKTIKHIEIIIIVAVTVIALLIYLGVSKSAKDDSKLTAGGSVQIETGDETSDNLQKILTSIDGVGDCKVMITYGEGKEVEGVVIVAAGADDTKVKLKIIDAVCALINVSSKNVKIYKMQ